MYFWQAWDVTTTGGGEVSLHLEDSKAMEISCMKFSSSGAMLAVVINNCDHVIVLETDTGAILHKLEVGQLRISTGVPLHPIFVLGSGY